MANSESAPITVIDSATNQMYVVGHQMHSVTAITDHGFLFVWQLFIVRIFLTEFYGN